MRQIKLIIIMAILLIPLVHAKDITLSLNQSEYYFKTGQEATINLEAKNTYKEDKSGTLTYSITQAVNQGNFQYHSSNTQSTPFSVTTGETSMPMSFGTSNSPATLTVTLRFSYTADEAREVTLDSIQIHFVEDESQKNNKKDKMSSSSQKSGQSQSSAQSQQQMNSQKLQNNQMPQDSSALKQQMQNQMQQKEQMKQEFQKQIAQNPEFQKEHQELLRQGYNITGAEVNPTSNNTGEFHIEYQKQDGEQATLQGNMEDGTLDMQKDTPETRKQMLDKLQEDPRFQKYEQQIKKDGFAQQNISFSNEKNTTNIQLSYTNPENKTATITAQLENKTVQDVSLDAEKKQFPLWIIAAAILTTAIAYAAYRKLSATTQEPEETEKGDTFDYRKASKTMIDEAIQLFEKKKYKDAYGRAGQALRLFLSYENNLRKEVTNDEIISFLKKHKKTAKEAKQCFDLCSLVEFAKYEPNKKDFDEIIGYAKKLIK